MKNIVLDFSDCKTIGEIYEVIKTGFDFPFSCGENLDALWDSLDCYCDFDLLVCVKGISQMPEECRKYFDKIMLIFERVTKFNPNIVFESIS